MLKINISRSFAMSLAYLLYCFGARKCPLHTISCLCKYVRHAWSVRWHHTTKWKKACKALKQFIWSWKPPCSRSLFYLLYHDCTIKDLHLTCRNVSGVCTCHQSSCTRCCHACNIGTWSSSENKSHIRNGGTCILHFLCCCEASVFHDDTAYLYGIFLFLSGIRTGNYYRCFSPVLPHWGHFGFKVVFRSCYLV